MDYKTLGMKVDRLLRKMGTTVSISGNGVVIGKGAAINIANKQSVNGLMSTSEITLILGTKVTLEVGQLISVWNMTITSIEPISPDGVTVVAYTVKGSI